MSVLTTSCTKKGANETPQRTVYYIYLRQQVMADALLIHGCIHQCHKPLENQLCRDVLQHFSAEVLYNFQFKYYYRFYCLVSYSDGAWCYQFVTLLFF